MDVRKKSLFMSVKKSYFMLVGTKSFFYVSRKLCKFYNVVGNMPIGNMSIGNMTVGNLVVGKKSRRQRTLMP